MKLFHPLNQEEVIFITLKDFECRFRSSKECPSFRLCISSQEAFDQSCQILILYLLCCLDLFQEKRKKMMVQLDHRRNCITNKTCQAQILGLDYFLSLWHRKLTVFNRISKTRCLYIEILSLATYVFAQYMVIQIGKHMQSLEKVVKGAQFSTDFQL